MDNSCVFYDKSLLEDLHDYSIKKNNDDTYYIDYGEKYGTANITETITPIIDSLNSSDSTKPPDIWHPYFIENKLGLIKNTLGGISIDDKIIGIEEAIKFEPKFKNWTVSGDYKMTTDWIINSVVAPFNSYYGILFWYKFNSLDKKDLTIDQIPYNAVVYAKQSMTYITKDNTTVSVSTTEKLIKKTNNILLKVDEDKLVLNSINNIAPNTKYKYFDLKEYLSYINKGKKDAKTHTKISDLLFSSLSTSDKVNKPSIFISEGEAYSYGSLSYEEWKSKGKEHSKTYLSPILFEKYQQIYNVLTLRYKKIIKQRIPQPLFTVEQNRLFKKLCYYLSTYPQLDRTTLSVLQKENIFDLVDEYINSTIDIKNEQKNLEKILNKISSYFIDISTNTRDYENINLIQKIIQKYGAKLKMNGSINIEYNPELIDGPNIKFTSDIHTTYNSSIKNGYVYNNTTISLGPFTVKTNITDSESTIILDSNNKGDKKPTTIPLWDISKKELVKNNLFFTTGQDIEIDFDNPLINNAPDLEIIKTNNEISIKLKSGITDDIENTIFAGLPINYSWSRVAGSDCLRFSNTQLTAIRDNGLFVGDTESLRFTTSADSSPIVYIKRPGKYIIQCVVNTRFGVKIDTVNIYITSAINKYPYSRPVTEIPRQKRDLSILPEDKNAIITPNLKEFIIGQQGIFWPIYSDLSIMEPFFIEVASPVIGLITQRRVGNTIRPLGSLLNKFAIPYEAPKDSKTEPAKLTIKFDCNNTSIEMTRIKLSHIFGENHKNCESMYRGIIDHKLFDLDLESDKMIVDPISKQDISVSRPNTIKTSKISIDTTKSPEISSIISNSKSDLIFNEFSYKADIYARKPDINNNNDPIICYENTPDDSSSLNSFVTGQSIKMTKGYFHPYSGWIKDTKSLLDFHNKTSIIASDNSKKYCKTFRGLGFDELKNDFIDGKTKIYSSTINISMNELAYDCAGCKDPIEHDKKELDDHNINYGYRDLSGIETSLYKYTDDLITHPRIDPEGPISNEEYCVDTAVITENNNLISFEFPKPGPIYSKEFRPSGLRFDRNFGRNIGDIEININFLNYINPKELVVWLEIEPPNEVISNISQSQSNSNIKDPWYFTQSISRDESIDKINSIQNEDIKNYISKLFLLNDNDNTITLEKNKQVENKDLPEDNTLYKKAAAGSFDPKYYIFLLNQDHISADTYNNILKFHDNTKQINTNINADEFITNRSQATYDRNSVIELRPTKSAPGYSDNESTQFKAIIDTNELYKYLGCNFFKFKNMPMFNAKLADSTAQSQIAKNSSSINFTLKVAIIGESDEGYVYDRVVLTDKVKNIDNARIRNISTVTTNNLCCWDVIISHRKENLNFQDKDVLGYIDFNNKKPKYYGYNFISKIPHNLIPVTNTNAPNRYIFNLVDTSQCVYARESLTVKRNGAIPQLSISPINYIPAFTLIGELINAGTMAIDFNNQAREWAEFFNDLRRTEQVRQFNREIYIPNYTNYPIGIPHKALLSISKDQKLWFKLEANILRYNNCPIVNTKQYEYRHIHYQNEFSDICQFKMQYLNLKYILQDSTKTIKTIISSGSYGMDLSTLTTNIQKKSLIDFIKNKILTLDNIKKDAEKSKTEFLYNSELSQYLSLYNSIGPDNIGDDDIIKIIDVANKKTTLYTASIDKTSKDIILNEFEDINTLLKYNKKFFIKNNLLFIHKYLTLKLDNSIVEDKIMVLDGLRPYSIFDTNVPINVFIPKEKLSDSEIKQIEQLNKQLKDFTTELSNLDKTSETYNTSKDDLNKKISATKESIFNVRNTSSSNTIIDKGTIFNGNSYYTIFAFQNSIPKDGAIIVITPEMNRVVVIDTTYNTKLDGSSTSNHWSFIQSNTLSQAKISEPYETAFSHGKYGSSRVLGSSPQLYDQEIINYIHDFAQYIDINKKYNTSFGVDCRLITDESNSVIIDENIDNIYMHDIYNFIPIPYVYNSFIKMKTKNQYDVIDPLNIILKTEKYNAFFKNNNLKLVLEGSLSNTIIDYTKKNIEFNQNIKYEPIYGFNGDADERELLKARLPVIKTKIEEQQKLMKDQKFATNATAETIQKTMNLFKDKIHKLKLEANKINFYLDRMNNYNPNILPNIGITVSTVDDGALQFIEELNDDHYFIDIDAEQGCSIDYDKTVKILQKITYECINMGLVQTVDAYRFCSSAKAEDSGINDVIANNTFKITIKGNTIDYEMTENKINEFKAKYASPDLDWSGSRTISNNRTFFLNGNGETSGSIVKATYTYLVPIYNGVAFAQSSAEGDLKNKVKDLFNLDNANELYINFKKIPRNIRNSDNLFDRYIPNKDGSLRKSLIRGPGGNIDATFKSWQCVNTKNGTLVTIPDNFKWMNLMKYLAFYNNYLIKNPPDINRGLITLKCRDEMELIPYEYE